MSFDSAWFDELRGISQDDLDQTRDHGITGYVPHVGELCQNGHVSPRFLEETSSFVRKMAQTRYPFDNLFRAYERHVTDFPRGRAFRIQWNVGFTAGDAPGDDYVRIGVGFRLSAHEESRGIDEYFEFRKQASDRQAAFDEIFHSVGNFYQFLGIQPRAQLISENAPRNLSDIVISDKPPLEGWRFFGKRLWFHDTEDQAVIGSHERLRTVAVEVFGRIQQAGFGYH